MALTRNVNGIKETVPADEETEILLQWSKNEAKTTERFRCESIQREALKRINAIFPALNSIDQIQFQAELWRSISPAARQPTPDFQAVINIYTVAMDSMNGSTLLEDVVWPV